MFQRKIANVWQVPGFASESIGNRVAVISGMDAGGERQQLGNRHVCAGIETSRAAATDQTVFIACCHIGIKPLFSAHILELSGISGAFNFLQLAARQTQEKHPEMKIRCVDSLRFGPGHGLMTVRASELRAEGLDLDAAADWLEENKNRYHQAGWLDDLSFVASKGRLTHPKAFFGTLAGVKPIGEFDYNGLTTVIGKVKGAKAAYAALLEYMAQTIEDPSSQTVYIAQSSRLPQAEAYREMILERFRPKEVLICDVHPLCGVNIGPGLMAAYYVGKPISADLSEERAIIEKVSGQG